MNAVEIQTHAQKLFAVHGTRALAEAAQRAREYEQRGDKEQARHWKQIETVLHQMRGPNVS